MESVEEIFERCGVVLKGHFILASKRHTGKYIDKFKIYDHLGIVSELCLQIAVELSSMFNSYTGKPIEVVVGPERGGKILARGVARHLQDFYLGEKVLVRFTKKDKKGHQILPARYEKDIRGKNVLVVDDILTTGGTARQVIEAVKKAGGNVLGLAVICNRGDVQSKDAGGVPIFAQLELKIEDWSVQECPLCAANVPINEEVGRGKKFVAKKAH